jgi:hypothetical protein
MDGENYGLSTPHRNWPGIRQSPAHLFSEIAIWKNHGQQDDFFYRLVTDHLLQA